MAEKRIFLLALAALDDDSRLLSGNQPRLALLEYCLYF